MSKIKILSLILLLVAINLSAQTFSGGSGAQKYPYLISSKADMEALANAVNNGTNNYAGKYFRLTQNLTGANALTTSVGDNIKGYSFQGVFDGNGYEIGLNNAPYGVFGYINYATIQNLGVSGTVSASNLLNYELFAGGICGYSSNSTIANCYNAASVSAVSTDSINSYTVDAGGICGYTYYTTITNCFNKGVISSSSYKNCYSGGICGRMWYRNILKNCYNTGDISAVCQNHASNNTQYAGGICADANDNAAGSQSIKNCFSANASIVAKYADGSYSSLAGRVVGNLNNTDIGNNYALSTMTVDGAFVSSSDAASKDGAGASLTNFKTQSWIQSNLAWDFDTIWKMSESSSVNQGFPVFKVLYTISASASSGGSITPSGFVSVIEGKDQAFTITTNTGYNIDQVLIDGTNYTAAVSSGSYTFTNVTANHTISVTFKLKQYTISATTDNNGIIAPSGNVSVAYNYNQKFTFIPITGYDINQVLIDGTNYGPAVSAGSYTFTNVTANHTIYVTFKIKQYTITATAGSNGSISPSGNLTVDYGSNKTFTFTPVPKYVIDNVLVDNISNASAIANGQLTFTNVTTNHTISVTFKPDCLSNIIAQAWNDVLLVINNPANNGGYTFVSYQWIKNGVDIPGEKSGSLYLANDPDKATAQYTCRVTTSTGQVLQSCPLLLTLRALSAYPNPTTGKLIIESQTLEQGDMINIYSSTGTLIKQISAIPRQTEIDFGNQPKGVYVIKVNGEQMKIIVK